MSQLERMHLSFLGLSVGDAFGECFFRLEDMTLLDRIRHRKVPPAPWRYTDDTEMALSVVEELQERGAIDATHLARAFAERMDLSRGYGAGAVQILSAVRKGRRWEDVSPSAFGGVGSFGNGAAMRVAPLGAYFAEAETKQLLEEARRSAEVTHSHAEGIAGAIAIAVGTALAWRRRDQPGPLGRDWLEETVAAVPPGYTRDGGEKALELSAETPVVDAAMALGNGSGVTAPDTVPLCLWVAAWHSERFEDALWTTVSALGDRDTTCAIVGGMIAPYVGPAGIPPSWIEAREKPPL